MAVNIALVVSIGELITPNMATTVNAFKEEIFPRLKAVKPDLDQTFFDNFYGKTGNPPQSEWDKFYTQELASHVTAIRLGRMDKHTFQENFCKAIERKFSAYFNVPEFKFELTPEKFRDAWCAMCIIAPEHIEDIRELFKNEGKEIDGITYTLFLYSGTNLQQATFIRDVLAENGIDLKEEKVTYSYTIGKERDDLITAVYNKIDMKKFNGIVRISADASAVSIASFREEAERRAAALNSVDGANQFPIPVKSFKRERTPGIFGPVNYFAKECMKSFVDFHFVKPLDDRNEGSEKRRMPGN